MGLFDLFNDIPEKKPSKPELIEININGIKYIIEGSKITRYGEKYMPGVKGHRACAPRILMHETVFTLKEETTLPGIYKCTYAHSKYSEGKVYYIGLDPKKALSDIYYIYYLSELVERTDKAMHSIDFMNDEQIKKFDFENLGNYIGTIALDENGELTTIQDEKAHEFSKQTPEMIRYRYRGQRKQYELTLPELDLAQLKTIRLKLEMQEKIIKELANGENSLGGNQR